MVLPEGTPPPERERPTAPTLAAVGIALLVLIGGALALGQATSPERASGSTSTTGSTPIIPPTTTTTFDIDSFSVGDIATGARFIWLNAQRLEPLWPIEMLEHDGSLYLFGTTEWPANPTHGGGLTALTSPDGITWTSLGLVIGDEYGINGIDSTQTELIATGNHAEARTPHIWLSADGADWRMSDLPVDSREEIPSFAKPTVATRFHDRLIVLGNSQSDLFPLILERLPDEVPVESLVRYGFGISNQGRALQVFGPLGLVGYSERLERLGIDDEVATWLLYTAGTDESLAWTSVDGSDWDLARFVAHYIDEIWHGPGDRLVASGLGVYGPMLWESADGREWARLGSSTIGQVEAMWQDNLIATTRDRHLLRSTDGLEWAYLGMNDVLPAALRWDMGPVAAGQAGLAAMTTMRRPSEEQGAGVVIEKDGNLIAIDPSNPMVRIETPDGDVVTFPLETGEQSEAISVDFVKKEVTFSDPDGRELVSVDFETLDRAEDLISNSRFDEERALLFTRDGRQWNIQSLSDEIGSDGVVSHMAVQQDRVILATYPAVQAGVDTGPPNVTIRVGIIGPGDTG